MSATVVTNEELHALRRRHTELGSIKDNLRRLNHAVPLPVAAELEALGGATVDVVIQCLLCGAFGTFPAAVNDDATPQSTICGECDKRCWEGAKIP